MFVVSVLYCCCCFPETAGVDLNNKDVAGDGDDNDAGNLLQREMLRSMLARNCTRYGLLMTGTAIDSGKVLKYYSSRYLLIIPVLFLQRGCRLVWMSDSQR